MSKNVLRWTPDQLAQYQRKRTGTQAAPAAAPAAEAKRPKYGNEKVELEGDTFDSRAEAGRWQQLLMLERAGQIRDLQKQVVFVLAPAVELDGRKKPALRYVADAAYWEGSRYVVEDTKSRATRKNRVYRIKKHLMKTVLGIEIQEYNK